MFEQISRSIFFRLLVLSSVKEIITKDKAVYLTFDDGPEPDITEFVLNILNKHAAKATFFCTGENFEKYPDLIKLIKNNGHSFGNHTYSHLHGLKEDYKKYIDDSTRSKRIIKSNLFRPPWGALTFREFMNIRKDNEIIMWSINSNDSRSDVNWDKHCQNMVKKTKPGSIILFHFSLKNASGTMKILPIYLDKLDELNYSYYSLKG